MSYQSKQQKREKKDAQKLIDEKKNKIIERASEMKAIFCVQKEGSEELFEALFSFLVLLITFFFYWGGNFWPHFYIDKG